MANGHCRGNRNLRVNSWVQKLVGNDPSTAEDDAFVNQKIAPTWKIPIPRPRDDRSGYNDNLWCDLNGNGIVDNRVKKGHSRCQLMGAGDWNAGYRGSAWMLCVRPQSSRTAGNWPTADRAYSGIFCSGSIYTWPSVLLIFPSLGRWSDPKTR